jgi:hypothetical protein
MILSDWICGCGKMDMFLTTWLSMEDLGKYTIPSAILKLRYKSWLAWNAWK